MSGSDSHDHVEMAAAITERLITLAKSGAKITERVVYDTMGVAEWPSIKSADVLIEKISDNLYAEQAVLDEATNVKIFNEATDSIYYTIAEHVTRALSKPSAIKQLCILEAAIMVSSVRVNLNGIVYSAVESIPHMIRVQEFPDFQSLESFLNTADFQALEADCSDIHDRIRVKALHLTAFTFRKLINHGYLEEFATIISKLLEDEMVPEIQSHLSEVHWPRALEIINASMAGITQRFKTHCIRVIQDLLMDLDAFPVHHWSWFGNQASNHRARIKLKYQASITSQASGDRGTNNNNGSLSQVTVHILALHWQLCSHISKHVFDTLRVDAPASLGASFADDFLWGILTRTEYKDVDVMYDIVDAPYLAGSPGFEHAYAILTIMDIVRDMRKTARYDFSN